MSEKNDMAARLGFARRYQQRTVRQDSAQLAPKLRDIVAQLESGNPSVGDVRTAVTSLVMLLEQMNRLAVLEELAGD